MGSIEAKQISSVALYFSCEKFWLVVLIRLFYYSYLTVTVPLFWAKIYVMITVGTNAIVNSKMYYPHTLSSAFPILTHTAAVFKKS